jgi:hypothetical protein
MIPLRARHRRNRSSTQFATKGNRRPAGLDLRVCLFSGAPKGIRILIVLVTIGTRWYSLVRRTPESLPHRSAPYLTLKALVTGEAAR